MTRSVDVGILRAPRIKFDLTGSFSSLAQFVDKGNEVVALDGKLCYCGELYDTLLFTPVDNTALFTLHDVVIGVNFHWQRKEKQTFKGELLFMVEEKPLLLLQE